MASVDLLNLVEYLDAKLNGVDTATTLFPVDDTRFVLALRSAFWNAKTAGFFASGYRESDGSVTNVDDPATKMPRDEQQVIVLYAALEAVEAKLLSLPTRTHDSAVTGLESDVERSSQLLSKILDGIRADLQTVRDSLQLNSGSSTSVHVVNGLLARSAAMAAGSSDWVR